MSEKKFNLIFKGEILPGKEEAAVKRNLGILFKIDEKKIAAMFSGRAVVLKRDVALDAANKYRAAIKKAGARVELVPAEGAAAAPAKKPAPAPQEKPPVPEQKTAVVDPDWSVAPVGPLLQEHEKRSYAPANVKTSHLSIRPQEGNLVDPSEIKHQQAVDIGDLNAELAPAGEDLLAPEERRKVKAVEVDTSGLTVGEPGERLEPEKPAPPPAPDVSDIEIAPLT